MIGDMKIDESSLTRYLAKNLEPLTEADPVILAEYVAALLKKDKTTKELQKLCTDNLVEFLGHDTKSFITKLFQALEDGSIVTSVDSLDTIKQAERSPLLSTVDPVDLECPSPNPERLSTSSGHASDPEEKEVSDDDDDDRNHKHRRRETQSQSFDKDAHEHHFRRPNRKRNQPYENGQLFLENDPQCSEICKKYNLAPSGRDLSLNFEKRRQAPFLRAPLDMGLRPRVGLAFRNDAARFDLSTPLACLPNVPIVRGRGRGMGSWNQQDIMFNSLESLDFASQMVPQRPTAPSLFAGRGFPNAATTQSASWGAFGLIHGMPNGGLDTLHALGFQGTLRPTLNPSMNIGIPRQRCRDFEERGFCLRGDVCPMEHGVNRIVVEDVQSLSQFNLPVSIPSSRMPGMQAGRGSLPAVTVLSSLLTNSKVLHNKSSKYGLSDDGVGLNDDADLYDPDQPLWNNGRPETSSALLRLSSPKIEDNDTLWGADPSECPGFKLSEGIDSERPGRSTGPTTGSQSTTSSVWGRIGNSGNKLECTSRVDNNLNDTCFLGNEVKANQEVKLTDVHGNTFPGKRAIVEEVEPKTVNSATATSRSRGTTRNFGRGSEKASRTLFVNSIPLKNNKSEALLSHFQKFGEVIDIHIPLNSERAFVQFSRKEDAEAALMAPDAVMGNRFIKLWWANRDSIPDDGESSGNAAIATSHTGVLSQQSVGIPDDGESSGNAAIATSHTGVLSQQSVAHRGKENLPSAAPKVNIAAPASNVPVSGTVPIPPRTATENGPALPSQKNLETLELLKEELRKKQEMLAQKRNDFRRQLDKLEKQGIAIKSDAVLGQGVKRQKVEMAAEVATPATPSLSKHSPTGLQPVEEKIPEKNSFGENATLPSAKTQTTVVQHSPRSLKQSIRLQAPGAPFLANRFKLDNRPTAFRVLPPLPANFANVGVLKEHFSSFTDLSAVELEDSEGHAGSGGSKSSENCSARITFTTRHSAESAFLNGKSWQGYTLQFSWLTPSSNSSNEHTGGENSVSFTPKGPPESKFIESGASSSPSSTAGKSSCSVISLSASTARNRESTSAEDINSGQGSMPKNQVETCQSSATRSSCERRPAGDDAECEADDPNLGFVR